MRVDSLYVGRLAAKWGYCGELQGIVNQVFYQWEINWFFQLDFVIGSPLFSPRGVDGNVLMRMNVSLTNTGRIGEVRERDCILLICQLGIFWKRGKRAWR